LDKINKWTANYFLYIVFFFLDQPKTWHQKAQNESRAESDLESQIVMLAESCRKEHV
jgi:hypothetical protein